MSNKADLQRKLKDIGYEIGQFASKDTLSNVLRLHSSALENTGIDVAKLNDLALRKNLTENGLTVGPVTSHTRAIYQRKLLEVLTNETSEGNEDEIEQNLPTSTTPPPRTTRNSTYRNEDNNQTASPGRLYSSDLPEPRIPLTRVDIEEKNTRNVPSFYPNLSNSKPKSDEILVHSYSSQRSSTKPESRNSNVSQGLRNPYDFQSDEPVTTRHEHKATPFRTTNISSGDTFSTNTNRFTPQSDIQSTTRNTFRSGNDISEIRARIFGNTNTNTDEQKDIKINKDTEPKKSAFNYESDIKKSTNNEKLDVVAKSGGGGGTILYAGITVAVALIVFVLYLWLE